MAQLPSSFAGAAELLRTSTIRPLTVLVVEDDPSLLSLAAHVFGKKGHHVLTDVDAFGAMALLRSGQRRRRPRILRHRPGAGWPNMPRLQVSG